MIDHKKIENLFLEQLNSTDFDLERHGKGEGRFHVISEKDFHNLPAFDSASYDEVASLAVTLSMKENQSYIIISEYSRIRIETVDPSVDS